MSTIPTIFNDKITPYTAVGGKERIASTGISAIVISNPGFQRRTLFQDLEKLGFDHILSIESSMPHYNIEELVKRFPFVRFILPEKELNLGEQINLAAHEIDNPLFFVIRSDMRFIAGGTAKRLAERLLLNEDEANGSDIQTGFKRLCTVPVIMNANYEIMPTLVSPMTCRKKLQPAFLEPRNEGALSLYPFDAVGIYDRQRFLMTGGFDITIKNSYWQLMDFGFRSHLWGEEIALSLQLKLAYNSEMPSEDTTVNHDYKRFYLKNLAPVFKNDYAHLPLYAFPRFFAKTGEDLAGTWEEFKECKKWITTNRFRWKMNARDVINHWEKTGEQNDIHHFTGAH